MPAHITYARPRTLLRLEPLEGRDLPNGSPLAAHQLTRLCAGVPGTV